MTPFFPFISGEGEFLLSSLTVVRPLRVGISESAKVQSSEFPAIIYGDVESKPRLMWDQGYGDVLCFRLRDERTNDRAAVISRHFARCAVGDQSGCTRGLPADGCVGDPVDGGSL